MFKGKAEHAAYGPVLSKPFVRFESSLHSFFNSRQRYTNQTNKTSSATSTRQTGQQILPQQGQQQSQPSAATNRRKIQTSGIAGDKGNRRGFKQTTGRGSARPRERKSPTWRVDSPSFDNSLLGGVPLAARPPELGDEMWAVSMGGKINRRRNDDQRVRKCRSPARGESDPRVGRDGLAAASLRRDAIFTVVLGWCCVSICVDRGCVFV